MDVLTHAVTGALVGRASGETRAGTLLVWAAAAAAPDLDGLSGLAGRIAYYTHHRAVLHSVAGAVLLTLLVVLLARRLGLGSRHRAAAIGAAAVSSHLLIDAMTSFGTELWFPFSRARSEWDVLFIVDPAFTALAILFLALSWRLSRRAAGWARVGLAALLLYTGGAAVSRGIVESRVEAEQAAGALPPGRVEVLPQPPSAGVWAAYVTTGDATWAGRVGLLDRKPKLLRYAAPVPDSRLDTAVATPAASRFLSFARFPHVSRTDTGGGTTFVFEDLRFSMSGLEQSNWWYGVRVEVGADGRVRYAGFANP